MIEADERTENLAKLRASNGAVRPPPREPTTPLRGKAEDPPPQPLRGAKTLRDLLQPALFTVGVR
jgi:hypothetical protein